METSFRTKNALLSETDRDLIEQKLDHLSHLADGASRVEVSFYEEKNPRIAERDICEVTMHTRWAVIRAKGSGTGLMEAADKVVEKLEHRIEKLKGKTIVRSHPHHRAIKSTGVVFDGDGEEEIALLGGARIVKEKSFSIPPMRPEDAALQMQLLSHDFYFFTNDETGRPAIVYQREDGHVGLIDAKGS
ncbi:MULTISPECIES: ribosome-associated translation inhibitor RaiA [Acidithrix]|uniref:Ribosome-associated factor Y n=1 Tax=Acidithrix ferrooxidans TaxID=1280514 RepID=A0A0D8HER3_9ACTN|nr:MULTISPECIES: ribosome-associated translation inhibitor RaiA [Acidithrix]KJF15546.1 ribosome-associated factor Y [Acidithrix ferrooxidans]CAG4928060.1 unnamed protein product [Acidithrix sp. C25]